MPSVALVVFDSLRKDTFDEHFNWLPGTRFTDAWSTSGWTVPAHGTLFSGLYPSESGVFAKAETLTTEGPVLAEALSNAGFTTRGFSANANISDPFDFTRGFDEFRHSWRGKRRAEDVLDWGGFISRTRDRGPERYLAALNECITSDVNTWKSLKIGVRMKARDIGIRSVAGTDDGAEQFLEFIENTSFSGDEFLFANLMEAHGPYKPPSEYQTVELSDQPSFEDTMFDGPDEDPTRVRQAYEDCVRYLSDIYEEIFNTLVADFDYVITLSDHGEMFGRDGLWDHNYGIYPELTHIPLVVYDGSNSKMVVDETVSLLDVYETVLDVADVQADSRRGQSLQAAPDGAEYLIERHGLRSSRVEALQEKGYSSSAIDDWDQPLYGVASPDADYVWESRRGIHSGESIPEDKAREKIKRQREEIDEISVELDGAKDVPKDVRERLNDLGYVSK